MRADGCPVPSACPDQMFCCKLEIDRIHYHYGRDNHVAMKGVSSTKQLTLVETAYYAAVTNITPIAVLRRPPTSTSRAKP